MDGTVKFFYDFLLAAGIPTRGITQRLAQRAGNHMYPAHDIQIVTVCLLVLKGGGRLNKLRVNTEAKVQAKYK